MTPVHNCHKVPQWQRQRNTCTPDSSSLAALTVTLMLLYEHGSMQCLRACRHASLLNVRMMCRRRMADVPRLQAAGWTRGSYWTRGWRPKQRPPRLRSRCLPRATGSGALHSIWITASMYELPHMIYG